MPSVALFLMTAALDEAVRSLTDLLPTLKDDGSVIDALSASCPGCTLNPLHVMHKLIKTGAMPTSKAWMALAAFKKVSSSSHGSADSTPVISAFASPRITRSSPLEKTHCLIEPSSPDSHALGPTTESTARHFRPIAERTHRSASLRRAKHAFQKPSDVINTSCDGKEEMSSSGSTEQSGGGTPSSSVSRS